MYQPGSYSVCVCVFINLHITAQTDPVILVILCHWLRVLMALSFILMTDRLEVFLFGLKVEAHIRVLPAEIDN